MNAPAALSHLVPEIHQREVPAALIAALKARFGDNCSTAMAVRETHGRDESSFQAPPPAAVVFAESTQDVADAVQAGQPVQRSGDPVRCRLLAGRPSAGGARRHQRGRQPHEQGAVRQCRGSHGDGAAGRDAQAAQRRGQEHRPVLPDRPWRRRVHRRHECHARQRNQRRPLRHHARERAQPGSGDGRRRSDTHRQPGQEIRRRL